MAKQITESVLVDVEWIMQTNNQFFSIS